MFRLRKPKVLLALMQTSVIWASQRKSAVILTLRRYFASVPVPRVWPWRRSIVMGQPSGVWSCSLQCRNFVGGRTSSSLTIPRFPRSSSLSPPHPNNHGQSISQPVEMSAAKKDKPKSGKASNAFEVRLSNSEWAKVKWPNSLQLRSDHSTVTLVAALRPGSSNV